MKKKTLKKKLCTLMKTVALCVVLCVMLPISAKAEGVKLNTKNFPDVNFRTYLKSTYDKDQDGTLNETELKAVQSISVKSKGIDDLTGIEKLLYVRTLNCDNNTVKELILDKNFRLSSVRCSSNQLKNLSVGDNYALNVLECHHNPLKSLDVTNNKALKVLVCNNDQLPTLNLNQNSILHELDCSQNELETLDLENNNYLEVLNCSGNRIQNLSVGQMDRLTELTCTSNQISKLDLANCIYLQKLLCGNNQLSEIRFPKNADLPMLSFYCQNNQLTSLDLSHMPKLTTLSCAGNQLWSLNVDKNTELRSILALNQNISLETDENQIIDLTQIPGMEWKKISNVKNATLKEGKLLVKKSPVSYDYILKGDDRLTVSIETRIHVHTGIEVAEKDATCGENGNKKYYVCECGNWYWNETCKDLIEDHFAVVVPKTNSHVYDEGTVIQVSTCTVKGKRRYTCTICGNKKTEKLSLQKHENETNVIPATKDKDGKVVTSCKNCGKVDKKIVIYKIKSISVDGKQPTYNGKRQFPKLLIKDSKGKKILSDYTVTYPKAVNVGQYIAKVKFQSLYSGTAKVKFQILPQKTKLTDVVGKDKKITVRWEKQLKQVDGYEIQYSSDLKFANKKTKSVKVTSKKTDKKTITNVQSKQIYYVRIRTYKSVSGKKYYSEWSKVRKVTVK